MKRLVLLVASFAVFVCPVAWAADRAIDAAVHDACGGRIVFLGEPAHHGSAEAVKIKGEVVRRLVDECHFDTVVFESPIYDFIAIERQPQSIGVADVLAAVGGIWSDDAEFQPIAQFLADEARHGKLMLAGMDDPISATGKYAADRMPLDLAALLPEPRASECRNTLLTHTQWKYDAAHPYGVDHKKRLMDCLDAIQSVERSEQPRTTELKAMAASLSRNVARDFRFDNDFNGGMNARDASMFENFRRSMSATDARRKIIVWTATLHAAHTLSGIPGLAGMKPFGQYVTMETSQHPFVIAVSALSGEIGRRKTETLSATPDDAIERRALASPHADRRYLDHAALAHFGAAPARVIDANFQTARWVDVINGLIVVRTDEAVTLVPPQKQ